MYTNSDSLFCVFSMEDYRCISSSRLACYDGFRSIRVSGIGIGVFFCLFFYLHLYLLHRIALHCAWC